jgi:hypothetical protein
MEINKWYIHDNGTFRTLFYCVAIDGEYMFGQHNINGIGYSLLLCRPATEMEINSSWMASHHNKNWDEVDGKNS